MGDEVEGNTRMECVSRQLVTTAGHSLASTVQARTYNTVIPEYGDYRHFPQYSDTGIDTKISGFRH
jgi:hypothetical protein